MLKDDNDFEDMEGEEWKTPKIKPKSKNKKIKKNPDGPFKIKFTFKNIDFNITIDNISEDEYKVSVKSNKTIDDDQIESLKYYLQEEGFEEEARKHNLYWFLN